MFYKNNKLLHALAGFFLFLLGAGLTLIINLWFFYQWNFLAFLAMGSASSVGFLFAPGLLILGGFSCLILSFGLLRAFGDSGEADQDITSKDQLIDLIEQSNKYWKLAIDSIGQKSKQKYIRKAQAILLRIFIAFENKKNLEKVAPRNPIIEDSEEIPELRASDFQELLAEHYLYKYEKTVSSFEKHLPHRLLKVFFGPLTEDAKRENSETESLAEKYPPKELLNVLFESPISIREQKIEELDSPNNQTTDSPSVFSENWVKGGGPKLTYQIDQKQNQQQMEDKKHVDAVDLTVDMKLAVAQDLNIDNSEQLSFEKVYQKFQEEKFYFSLRWGGSFENAVKEKNKNSQLTFKISTLASDVMLAGRDSLRHARENSDFLDLNALPLGFFYVIEKDNCILKFSPTLRKNQLSSKETRLRLDPYSYFLVEKEFKENKISSATINRKVSYDELMAALKEKNISLTGEQENFLANLKTDERFLGNASHMMNNYIFNALKEWSERASPAYLLFFLDQLIRFNGITFRVSKEEKNLLHHFTSVFLVSYLDELISDSVLKRSQLQRLATLKPEQLAWFYALTHITVYSYDASFGEAMGGLLYFVDFFEEKNLPFPQDTEIFNGVGSQAAFLQLRGILGCLTTPQDKTKEALALQAKLIGDMPKNLGLAKRLLQRGYTIVHVSMRLQKIEDEEFKNFFPGLKNSFLIDTLPEYQKDTLRIQKTYDGEYIENPIPDFYQAIFFRYVAACSDAETFEKAMLLWKACTGFAAGASLSIKEMQKSHKNLCKNWEKLKKFTLALPKKTLFSNLPDDDKEDQKQISCNSSPPLVQDDIDALLRKLGLEKTEYPNLANNIKDLDNYCEWPEEHQEFVDAFQKIKQKNPKDFTDTLKGLAFLREAHYRLTKQKNSSSKGQWLRLEQIVVILLALEKGHLFQIDTSEGKTLITEFIALMHVLQGKKVDLITHSNPLAKEAFDQLAPLAHVLNIKLADDQGGALAIAEADIFYCDIGRAVIREELSLIQEKDQEIKESKRSEEIQSKQERKPDIAIFDEVDNIAIDIHGSTTMQISQDFVQANQKSLEAFLIKLNEVVRDGKRKEATKDLQRTAIKDEFLKLGKEDGARQYYDEFCSRDDIALDFWISAAATAVLLKEKEDYVVTEELDLEQQEEIEAIRIVHKETTGRVDKVAQWGDGVHACVAAWEKARGHPKIKIPGLSKVIAEGNVFAYAKKYKVCHGVTGTIGSPEEKRIIMRMLNVSNAVIMPRSKKSLPDNGIKWPQVARSSDQKLEEKYSPTEEKYSRTYVFPTRVCKDKQKQYEELLSALRQMQNQGKSGIIFLESIKDCEEMYYFLTENNISTDQLQLLDDTNEEEQDNEEQDSKVAETEENKEYLQQCLAKKKKASRSEIPRPPESVVINRANTAGMITLTTAAGARGTDFKKITFAFLLKPALQRVLAQEEGRVGRNLDLGIVYKIYNKENLPKMTETISPESEAPIKAKKQILADPKNQNRPHFSFLETAYSDHKREIILKKIDAQGPLQEFKQKVEKYFFFYLSIG